MCFLVVFFYLFVLEWNFLTHLNLRPVGGHARTEVVLPPFEIILLADGHQCVVELIVHRLHTDRTASIGLSWHNKHTESLALHYTQWAISATRGVSIKTMTIKHIVWWHSMGSWELLWSLLNNQTTKSYLMLRKQKCSRTRYCSKVLFMTGNQMQ